MNKDLLKAAGDMTRDKLSVMKEFLLDKDTPHKTYKCERCRELGPCVFITKFVKKPVICPIFPPKTKIKAEWILKEK